jgi:hypothetical protein
MVDELKAEGDWEVYKKYSGFNLMIMLQGELVLDEKYLISRTSRL